MHGDETLRLQNDNDDDVSCSMMMCSLFWYLFSVQEFLQVLLQVVQVGGNTLGWVSTYTCMHLLLVQNVHEAAFLLFL